MLGNSAIALPPSVVMRAVMAGDDMCQIFTAASG